ncbi:hypothetical protein GWK08_03185 [Leptobacterium flavescens]|uniref:Uncharacterized protein n=1 Tax=Leptobacterium flavescens TaxID=472055 RepID=A0A6P0UIS2_9FLAO|nr:ankyrin repeat domain-containing protein [Leptobacterium flavescens]NER12432.1 hypothetical protein [Leptobacterium flavescens]
MKKTVFLLAIAFAAVSFSARANTEMSPIHSEGTEITTDVGINAFCMAIAKGDMETVKKLIEQGENVNKKSRGMTPAMWAARYNRVEILKLLIDKGANLHLRSNQGFKALKYAEAAGAKEAMQVIKNALNT